MAALIGPVGDFVLAEEALVEALRTWPERGVPDNPAAWITTTGRRKAIDVLRRSSRLATKQRELEIEATRSSTRGAYSEDEEMRAVPDERLRLHIHLLSPRVVGRRPGGADTADAWRSDDPGDRPRVPRSRADHGPASGTGEAQDS